MSKILVISVKPEYAAKIFSGVKTIELRKQRPHIELGTVVLVYSTTPDKSAIGFCRVKAIIRMSPSKIWEKYSKDLGISRRKFFEYYKGIDFAIGIQLEEVKKFNSPVELSTIRQKIKRFAPPQTFNYILENEFMKIA